MSASTQTEAAIREAFTDADGTTKLPGSIVNPPRGGPAQVARARGWTRKCGQRVLMTLSGYREV